MNNYIALLKGINVGGHKKVPMADLRALLTKSGFENVQTYIQSGNVILQSFENKSKIQKQLEESIKDHFGFEVSVIVKTNKHLQKVLDDCPFEKGAKEKSYFVMFNKKPSDELVKEAKSISYDEGEEIIIKNDCLYFYSANGYGQSKFNMNTFERKLKVIGTSRNYNTMLKLLSLSAE
ncbi:DUF1697 domain-containing protein [Subsaxibacter sp. CAU 1640]|uniref:DUF1697 domain-containing protein n=1 Tax=Subsaxibacter sp. CAU 1640 TaxID=2933271 RepID=UPI0020035037|nr:DUF1697 domain-containing protein [Subsaxibacter sp. CAU 1640]MCK7589033.1 DUF1697 domain-containing protein [Subsaxibacter sp. CAU 1640]